MSGRHTSFTSGQSKGLERTWKGLAGEDSGHGGIWGKRTFDGRGRMESPTYRGGGKS